MKYQYGGNQEGEAGFEPCYAEVLRVVRGKLHQPEEIHRSSFYAFSYYYDRAVDTDMIDYEKGGVLKVEDFERKAREVCDNLDNFTSGSPFLCMDLSYITALLRDGFGFADSTVLQVREWAGGVSSQTSLGVGRKELTCLIIRVAIGGIRRISIWAMDKNCAGHYECGNDRAAVAASKYSIVPGTVSQRSQSRKAYSPN